MERTNSTDKGYTYGGKDYTYETRYDFNNQPYQVATTSSPTVISNYGMNKKVGDITSTYQNNINTSTPSFPTGTKRAVYAPSGDGYTGEFLGYAGTPQEEETLMSQFSQRGQTSYGTDFTAPEGAQLTPEGTYLYQGQYYTKDQLGSPENLASIQNVGLQQKRYDEALQSELDSINKRYDMYKQEQQRITASGAAGAQTALLQSGAGGRGSVAQYASVTADQRVNTIMADGQRALADLDAKRDELLSAAKVAYADKDYKLLENLNTQIEKNRTAMLDVTREANKKVAEATRQAGVDTAIASLYESGVTDPTEIIKKLREQGRKDITLKDISDSIKNITPEGLDDIVKTARNNGAPSNVIQSILSAKNVSDAYKAAGTYASGGTGIIGEYNFYRSQAELAGQTPVDFNTYQTMDANRKAKIAGAGTGSEMGLYIGLTPATATAVRSQVSAFKSEPMITNFSTIQEGYNFAKSLSDTTKNPADDQALIYALAKALDPGSVVREGEYATAQKYAQSWISSFGKSITQAMAGTGFLSQEARKNIKKAIESKYNASKRSYDTVRNDYVKGINDITGRDDGDKFVRDYQTPTITDDLIKSEEEAKQKVIDLGNFKTEIREQVLQMRKDGASYIDIYNYFNQP